MFIILDRDGVINHESAAYVKTPEEWIPIPGSLEAMASLSKAGFRILIATNQSGVARGYYDHEMLGRIHEKLTRELAVHGGTIEEIFYCPHHPDVGCNCRKPKPGLIHQIQQKYPVVLEETYFIGDSDVDMFVAKETGCRPLLVLTGRGQAMVEKYPEFSTIPHFANLKAAVEHVLKNV